MNDYEQTIKKLVDNLMEVDVTGIEPMTSPIDATNVFREDVPKPGLTQDQALANAPEKARGCFVVPKIVE